MSRFKEAQEEDLLYLLEKRDSLSTKNVIKCAVNILNITREIQNLQDSKFQDAQMNMTTAAPTENYNFPFVQTSASVHKFQNQRSQCVAPIYYFPNSTVHIHHH